MRNTFLAFSPPVIGEEEIAEVVATLRSPWITAGPKVMRFEEAFARYLGAPAALALNSCSAALHLSLVALGVGPGDAVITTPLTFAATVHAIEHVGARPILVDVEPETLTLDPNHVADVLRTMSPPPAPCAKQRGRNRRRLLTPQAPAREGSAKAILPVHLYGHPCELDSLREIAGRYGLALVEDAAHALPARYKGRRVGAPSPSLPVSNLICFSFYATKNLTTAEGGMLTGPRKLVEEARLWSQQGIRRPAASAGATERAWNYQVLRPGFNYNMTDIQAAIGLHQLTKLNRFHHRRQEIAARYNEAFSRFEELDTLVQRRHVEHAWHLYALRLRLEALRISRDQFIEALRARKIGASVHFIPIHLHPYYRHKYNYQPGDFPVAYRESQRLLSLPLNPGMDDGDVEDVIEAVLHILMRYKRKSCFSNLPDRAERRGGRTGPGEFSFLSCRRPTGLASADQLPRKQESPQPAHCSVSIEKCLLGIEIQPWPGDDTLARRLLGRRPIRLDLSAARRQLRGQRLMVTGAGGSIGLELSRQLAKCEPELLLLYERAENNLYDAFLDLKQHIASNKLVPVLGDILDRQKIERIIQTYTPQLLYHAAAFKHVPLTEQHPLETIENNVFGVETVALAAQRGCVRRFVYVSTDKAVRPAGIMGMTKRVGERLVFSLNTGAASFAAVRLGNVLLSRGSALCVFRHQIAKRVPLTITHPEASRYFLLPGEAVGLALLAGAFGDSRDTYLLRAGNPIRVLDLAHNLIRLLSLEPGEDIRINVVGLRPGEKLKEELIAATETLLPTRNANVFRVREGQSNPKAFREDLEELRHRLRRRDRERAVAQLRVMATR